MASQLKREIDKRGGINAPDLDPCLIYTLAGAEDCRLAEMIERLAGKFCSRKNHAAQLLAAAARKNANSPLVAWLLKHGVAVNSPLPRLNALFSACFGVADRNVSLLLAAGADPNSRNEIGRTPLVVLSTVRGGSVILRRQSKIVEALAEYGARFELGDMCFLEILNYYTGLGLKSEAMLKDLMKRFEDERRREHEEYGIYRACADARIAPPANPRSL